MRIKCLAQKHYSGGGGGGGGGHFHICAIFETPVFSPKFPLQSISFSQITEISAPEHHHFRVFAAPETIIFQISYLQAVSSPPTVGLLRPADGERSGVIAAPETTNFMLEPAPETHLFTLAPARARARDQHFHAQTTPEPHIFHLAVAHTLYLPKCGSSAPPPPPPPGALLLLPADLNRGPNG